MSGTPEQAPQDFPAPRLSLEGELREVVNRHSVENASDTPDFILAQFLLGCLTNFASAVNKRESWYGRPTARIGGPAPPGVSLRQSDDPLPSPQPPQP